MAITINIPSLAQNLTQAQVIDKLLESLPEFEIYVISFFMTGIYWIAYHQTFNNIVGSHHITTWLTLVFLFFITLIPLATNLQFGFGQYDLKRVPGAANTSIAVFHARIHRNAFKRILRTVYFHKKCRYRLSVSP